MKPYNQAKIIIEIIKNFLSDINISFILSMPLNKILNINETINGRWFPIARL